MKGSSTAQRSVVLSVTAGETPGMPTLQLLPGSVQAGSVLPGHFCALCGKKEQLMRAFQPSDLNSKRTDFI